MTARMSITKTVMMAMVIIRLVAILRRQTIPTRHSPKGLDAPVDVALALDEDLGGVLDLGALREGVAVLQPPAAAVQPIRAPEQLLPLLQLHVRRRRAAAPRRVVLVPAAKQRGPVAGQGVKSAPHGVDVRLVVAEALVHARARARGNVLLLLQPHLAEQFVGLLERPARLGEGGLARLTRKVRDRVELLGQVGLHELQLRLVRGEELRARFGVEGVGHGEAGIWWSFGEGVLGVDGVLCCFESVFLF
ncbi:hypothetical protein M0657_003740 [Pyricularia oryzae]|nr:hypothetical protein M9X92_005027 [Pyricularia oryzae]KAI7926507.1 hypothetical protein M0657_003740 [Pyricularia oryzae]